MSNALLDNSLHIPGHHWQNASCHSVHQLRFISSLKSWCKWLKSALNSPPPLATSTLCPACKREIAHSASPLPPYRSVSLSLPLSYLISSPHPCMRSFAACILIIVMMDLTPPMFGLVRDTPLLLRCGAATASSPSLRTCAFCIPFPHCHSLCHAVLGWNFR